MPCPRAAPSTWRPPRLGPGGSSYEGDSLRLTGSLKCLNSVLGNLKSLLRFDNAQTRLDVAFSQQKHQQTGEPVAGKYVVYLKVVEKVRTTRARAATAVPAPAKAAPRPRTPKAAASVAAPAPAIPPVAVQEALEALRVLGQAPAEAQRRLELVVATHGPGLECAAYVTLALRVPLAKKAPPPK